MRGRLHPRLARRRSAVLAQHEARAAGGAALYLGAQRCADLGRAGPIER